MSTVKFTHWMTEGPLGHYVKSRRLAGSFAGFECAQPPGDMSDPPTDSLVLVQTLSPLIRHHSDFGSGHLRSEDRRDTLYIVPPDVATSIQVFDHHVIRSYAFPVESFSAAVAEYLPGAERFDFGRLHRGGFRSQAVSRLAGRLWDQTSGPGRASALSAHGQCLQIIAALHDLAFGPAKPIRGGLSSRAHRRCIEHLEAHIDQDVTLEALAQVAGLSPFHFSRMFKATTGLSPAAYQRQLRVERARDLLTATDLPIREVALRVGYSSPQAFARMFRDLTGRSPSDHRT